jgi:aryl-alcohol dehydrogenase-like predicted oxidoreductase
MQAGTAAMSRSAIAVDGRRRRSAAAIFSINGASSPAGSAGRPRRGRPGAGNRRGSSGENFGRNLGLVARIDSLARRKGCTPAQLAPAWVLARGEDIVPIRGTRLRRYLDENLAAADLALAAGDLAAPDEAVPSGAAAGARYPEPGMRAAGR